MNKQKILNIIILIELIILISFSIFSKIARNILFSTILIILLSYINLKSKRYYNEIKLNKK